MKFLPVSTVNVCHLPCRRFRLFAQPMAVRALSPCAFVVSSRIFWNRSQVLSAVLRLLYWPGAPLFSCRSRRAASEMSMPSLRTDSVSPIMPDLRRIIASSSDVL